MIDGSPDEDEDPPRSERSSKGKKGPEKGSRKGSEKGSGKGSDKGKGKKGKAKKGKRLYNRGEVEDIVARALERQDRQRREEAQASSYYQPYRSYATPGYYFHQKKYKYWDGGPWTHDWEGGSFGSYGERSSSARSPNQEGDEPSRGSTASRPDQC